MLHQLTEQLYGVFSKLRGKKTLSEANIVDAVREVRLALLEADVNYSVAKVLVKRIKEKALGLEVVKSVTPGEQFIKLVHDELQDLMGGDEEQLNLTHTPTVIMMCGLQGSGKTTTCAKLAQFLMKKGKKKPLLAACDLQRPAAIEQLRVMGEKVGADVFVGEGNPVKVAAAALAKAKREHDVLIVDTAGRLSIDDALMQELEQIKKAVGPHEVLFVANATLGQDAVNVAKEFNERIEVTGTVLTMLDGNARGGAAISIREVTGKPLKFEGVGEETSALQVFNPSSMADRILGMGDRVNLVRKMEEHVGEEDAKEFEEKVRKASFTFNDYLKQMSMVKKMGSFKSLISMLPGMGKMSDMDLDEGEFVRAEAMILSMTPAERDGHVELSPSRRKRVANGSGTQKVAVDRLVKSFKQAKQFFKKMPKGNKNIEKMMGGAAWR